MDSIFICGSGIAVKSRSRGGGILFSDNEFGVGICCIGVGIGLNGIGLAPNGVGNALILSNNETGGGGGGGGTASKYLWIEGRSSECQIRFDLPSNRFWN